MNSEDLARFEAQSFLFACGKVDAAEQAWMANMIAAHPELAEAAHADRVLVEHSRAAVHARAAAHTEPLVPFDALPRLQTAKNRQRTPAQPWWQHRTHQAVEHVARALFIGRGVVGLSGVAATEAAVS